MQISYKFPGKGVFKVVCRACILQLLQRNQLHVFRPCKRTLSVLDAWNWGREIPIVWSSHDKTVFATRIQEGTLGKTLHLAPFALSLKFSFCRSTSCETRRVWLALPLIRNVSNQVLPSAVMSSQDPFDALPTFLLGEFLGKAIGSARSEGVRLDGN